VRGRAEGKGGGVEKAHYTLYGLLEQLVVRYSTDNHPSWFGLARGGGETAELDI